MIRSPLDTTRRTRALGILAAIALVASVALVVAACSAAAGAPQGKTMYRCPMHPQYVSDRPGDCPICGMRLVAFDPGKEKHKTPPATPATRSRDAKTTDPALGSVRESGRGALDAPMPSEHQGHMPPEEAAAPQAHDGHASIPGNLSLGADRARLTGVRSVAAAPGEVARSVRAVGTVAIDETRVRQVTTKVAGFVERLYVNATGQMVRQGQPLFDLFSPELIATQEEYLRARESAASFSRSALPEVQRGGEDLVASARRRLELFDVPREFIEALDRTGKAQRTVTFKAPFAGFVTGKAIVAGQRIEPGMELLTVSDLSRVWVLAQVYEADAAVAQPGRAASITLPYDPSARLSAKVDFVYPTLEADTRTLKVRLLLANPRGALKPGMFVTVALAGPAARGIVVPDSAVIDSGPRSVVFVETAPGDFTAREVGVVARQDGRAVLRSGVAAGERVAVSANFLLDSESRLRTAAAAHSHQ